MTSSKASMTICGRELVVQGRVCRIAHVDAESYKFLDDPEARIEEVRRSKKGIDLFTFLQGLPDTTPKHNYPIEWDNLAVLNISTYENWWTKQIGFKARNKAKQAEKKGVVVREANSTMIWFAESGRSTTNVLSARKDDFLTSERLLSK